MEIRLFEHIKQFSDFPLSTLTEDIEYIKLETNQQTLLTHLRHIDFQKDKIIVSDYRKCLLFSRKGEFVRPIGRNGRGEGEYSFNSSISFAANGEEVFIQDSRNLLSFSGNGDFEFKINLPFSMQGKEFLPICSWLPVNDSVFIGQMPNSTGKEKYKAVIFNKKGRIIHQFPNYIHFDRRMPYFGNNDYHTNIYKFDGEISFKEMMNDTLFRLRDEKLIPAYVFQLGKFSLPKQERGLDMELYIKNLKNYILLWNVFESSDYFILECDFNKYHPIQIQSDRLAPDQTKIFGVFRKSDRSLVYVQPSDTEINPNGFKNDIDGGPNFYPKKIINNNTLVGWIDAYQLVNYINSNAFKGSTPKYPEKKKKLEKLAGNLTENDNPVLMLVKLKKE